MTPAEYNTAIEHLGLSQRKAGKFLGVNERTSRRWVSGESPIPEPAARLLQLCIKLKYEPRETDFL